MVIRFGKYKILDFSGIGFLEIFLPIYSVLMYYTLPVVGSVGQIILLIYIIVYFFTHKNIRYNVPKFLLLFTIYVIPVQLVVFYTVGGLNLSRIVNLLMIVFYLIILSCFNINIDGLYKVYKIVALFACITIIIQFVQIQFFNQVVHQIMLLPIERPEAWYSEGLRPQGIFPEPQVFATFMLPILVLTLRKFEYLWAMFFTFAILASTSSLGIICSAGIWVYYVLFSQLSSKKKAFIIAVIFIGVLGLTQTSLFEYGINKITTTNFTNNVRLTRGFTIYAKIPMLYKLFGIGVNNLAYYQESGQIILNDYMSIAMRNSSYITTVSELLINFGLFATLIYLRFLMNLFKNSECRLLVVLLIVLSFAQTILFSGVWYLYMIIIFATLKENNNCYLKNFLQ
jgi:hypothetical protein